MMISECQLPANRCHKLLSLSSDFVLYAQLGTETDPQRGAGDRPALLLGAFTILQQGLFGLLLLL